MFDAIVKSEGQPDVVQISGGEPTIHPEFFKIMDMAKTKPIKHLMLNTNGFRIADDLEFTQKLASYAPDFEVYLQFDSFERDPLIAKGVPQSLRPVGQVVRAELSQGCRDLLIERSDRSVRPGHLVVHPETGPVLIDQVAHSASGCPRFVSVLFRTC